MSRATASFRKKYSTTPPRASAPARASTRGAQADAIPKQARVLVLAGGGVEHTSGGVGTLLLYLQEAWAKLPGAPSLTIIDTRGQGGALDGAWRFLLAFFSVLTAAALRRVSLLHAHMTTRGSVARKCLLASTAYLFGVPVIMHMHGADFFEFYRRLHPLHRTIVRKVLRRASYVVVLGETWRRFLIDELELDSDSVVIVSNGVAAPDRRAPARIEKADRPIRIVFLGRLGERKGVPELIDALAAPALKERSWTATIAGDGEIELYRERVAARALGERLDLPGWVDRAGAAALLSQADIMVLPSHHEAMPIALLEAMAFEVAIVTTPVGAIPEFLSDGESALLVPPGDRDHLAAALIRLIDDPRERARIAEGGHAIFRQRFDIRSAAAVVLGLYAFAIAGKKAPTAPQGAVSARPAGNLGRLRATMDRIQTFAAERDVELMLEDLAHATRPRIVSFVNQHAMNVAWSNPRFAADLIDADFLLRDGIGVEIGLALMGRRPGLNLNGTDFIPRIVRHLRGRRIALYGTCDPWLGRAAEGLRKEGHQVVSVRDGFLPDEAYAAAAAADRPELIILAMGMPKQERIAAMLAAASSGPTIIVNGGAIADFWAGRVARAPMWIRRARLEWAFRIMLEPGRLWRRYVFGGAAFAFHLFRLAMASPVQGRARNRA